MTQNPRRVKVEYFEVRGGIMEYKTGFFFGEAEVLRNNARDRRIRRRGMEKEDRLNRQKRRRVAQRHWATFSRTLPVTPVFAVCGTATVDYANWELSAGLKTPTAAITKSAARLILWSTYRLLIPPCLTGIYSRISIPVCI